MRLVDHHLRVEHCKPLRRGLHDSALGAVKLLCAFGSLVGAVRPASFGIALAGLAPGIVGRALCRLQARLRLLNRRQTLLAPAPRASASVRRSVHPPRHRPRPPCPTVLQSPPSAEPVPSSSARSSSPCACSHSPAVTASTASQTAPPPFYPHHLDEHPLELLQVTETHKWCGAGSSPPPGPETPHPLRVSSLSHAKTLPLRRRRSESSPSSTAHRGRSSPSGRVECAQAHRPGR